MATPTQDWTNEQLLSDAVSKKDIVTFLHLNASHDFLVEYKLTGKLPTVVKNAKKDSLLEAYSSLFARQAFRGADEPSEEELMTAKNAAPVVEKKEVAAEVGPPKFTKTVLKKGDKSGYPRKGSNVGVFYTGYFEDGTVFDTNDNTKKKNNPLRFRVGTGRVIAGWDEAMLSMSRGEKAKITIEPEHAYGKKGVPDAKVPIPPNSRLIFDVELVSLD
ncbi:FK506 binding protein 3, 25kDa [Gamsiella multidivaricata]|uniref:FK506 binding protein 3, 25kDa n=1 Tax=Gamsiella multidivaricata TaxID=101098 RepID=UPI00221F113B|nr:FK506 binding protein 3, 25kDa [Gamsiella multidivaricata]KAG0371267.1 FK506-binding protein 2B [Gamsiella multidivaricata]KAI7823883.1 FK506 binding protein 3, 25kDa [Gamsiella multidivaricata]